MLFHVKDADTEIRKGKSGGHVDASLEPRVVGPQATFLTIPEAADVLASSHQGSTLGRA